MNLPSGSRGVVLVLGALLSSAAWADNYTATIELFQGAVSSEFFDRWCLGAAFKEMLEVVDRIVLGNDPHHIGAVGRVGGLQQAARQARENPGKMVVLHGDQ